MKGLTQTDHAVSLIVATKTLDVRAQAIRDEADAAELAWRPPTGGWSVGEVFEHLCVANDSYLVMLRHVLANPPAGDPRAGAQQVWRPSLAGRMLVASFTSPRKLPAPKMWRPEPIARPHVIDAFLERQAELVELIERSLAFKWMRVRLASPVSLLIRMNVGDAFNILVRHAERHFAQIDRVRASKGSESNDTPSTHRDAGISPKVQEKDEIRV